MAGGAAVLTLLVLGRRWRKSNEVRNSVQGTLARELTVTDANVGMWCCKAGFERQRRRRSGGN